MGTHGWAALSPQGRSNQWCGESSTDFLIIEPRNENTEMLKGVPASLGKESKFIDLPSLVKRSVTNPQNRCAGQLRTSMEALGRIHTTQMLWTSYSEAKQVRQWYSSVGSIEGTLGLTGMLSTSAHGSHGKTRFVSPYQSLLTLFINPEDQRDDFTPQKSVSPNNVFFHFLYLGTHYLSYFSACGFPW